MYFLNPTWVDNCPITNSESLACGTPVITYKTGGSPESINENSGIVVQKGDITFTLFRCYGNQEEWEILTILLLVLKELSELYNKDVKYKAIY